MTGSTEYPTGRTPGSRHDWNDASADVAAGGYAPGEWAAADLAPVDPASGQTGYAQSESAPESKTEVAKEAAQVAKGQAADVAGTAGEAASHVAGVVKEQVADVSAEAGRQVKHLASQAQSELAGQASTQQQRAAAGLRSVGGQLKSLVDGSPQQGMVSDLAAQGADKVHEIAGWLENRDPAQLLAEVKTFARRRPGVFLAVALGAGVLAGRLARGLTSDSDAPDPTASANRPTSALTPVQSAGQLGYSVGTAGYPAQPSGYPSPEFANPAYVNPAYAGPDSTTPAYAQPTFGDQGGYDESGYGRGPGTGGGL